MPTEIDAAHELVGTAVDPHPVHEDRQHLERLRAAALGVGEAAADVRNDSPYSLPCRFASVAQQFAQLRHRHAPLRLDDQVALARHDRPPLLAPPVAVRLREAARRRPAEQEARQHAVRRPASRAAPPRPRRRSGRSRSARAPPRRDSVGSSYTDDERRHDRLADLLGERLPFLLVLLAVALDAVAEDLVEPQPGGRFYEEWGHRQGAVRGVVTAIRQDDCLELAGALFGQVHGRLSFSLEPREGGTLLAVAWDQVPADAIDDLIRRRLKAFVETGARTGVAQ